jgi:steroid delta-isomerase-like uncharacterized protein
MSVETNKEAVKAFHQAVFVERNLDALSQFMREPLNGVNATGRTETLAQVRQYFQSYFDAFPDLQAAIDDISAENDLVNVRLILTGTHGGTYMGAAPSGKGFSVSSMHIFRFDAEGKIIERWEWVDRLGLRAQLGIQ